MDSHVKARDNSRPVVVSLRFSRSSHAFRVDLLPRIALTVDMIATGADIKPIKCLIFLRNMKSEDYNEHMKGYGVLDMRPYLIGRCASSFP